MEMFYRDMVDVEVAKRALHFRIPHTLGRGYATLLYSLFSNWAASSHLFRSHSSLWQGLQPQGPSAQGQH